MRHAHASNDNQDVILLDDGSVIKEIDLSTFDFPLRHFHESVEREHHATYGRVLFEHSAGTLFINRKIVFAHSFFGTGMVTDAPLNIAHMAGQIQSLPHLQPLTLEMASVLGKYPELIPPCLWGKKILTLGSIYKRRRASETFILQYSGQSKADLMQIDVLADWQRDYVASVFQAEPPQE